MPQTTVEVKKTSTQSVLTCRLRAKGQERATAGELELENTSTEAVEIEYDMSVLQYVNLIVSTLAGEIISEGHYGDSFSPMAKSENLHLNPGDKFTGPIALFSTVPREKRLPGRYAIQAVYEYCGARVVSERILVDLPT